MPITVPSGVTAGTTITEAWGDSVAAAIAYLATPPACRVYHDTTQSIADNSLVALVFNSERFDPTAMHSTSVSTGRITINDAGVYQVGFHGRLTGAADYVHVEAQLRLNGTTTIAVGGGGGPSGAATPEPVFDVSTIYKFAPADYVEVVVYQDNTANAARNLLSTAAFSPEFYAAWLGLGT